MDKSYLNNYKVEDFVTDESFINYHFRLNEKDIAFWEAWTSQNPSKMGMIEEAKNIIESFSLTLNKKEYQTEFKKIEAAINNENKPAPGKLLNGNKSINIRRRRTAYLLAGLFILALGSFYLFVWQKPAGTTVQLYQTIASGTITKTFMLNDSTIVTLSPNSSLKFPSAFEQKSRQVYLNGEANFQVKHNEHFPFKVHSKNIVTTVLGTVFNIKKSGDSAIVIELLKGRVNVALEDSISAAVEPIILYPNERATYVFHNNLFYKDHNSSLADISFQQNSFKEIASRIKNVFGKTVINNSDNKNWRFTGRFKNTSAIEVMQNICLIKNLHIKNLGDTIIINN